ncbi:MAG: hypothetical protein U9Q79_10245, partial [Candidatus Hydrogenedentes bacterium]|nr:hypothetical protein [Candidatus Hydrogenedentota bacterium]
FSETDRIKLGQKYFSGLGGSQNDILDTPNVASGPAEDGMPDVLDPGRLTQGQALYLAGKRRTVRAVVPASVIRAVPI